jgi:hypothetical protein
VGEENSLCGKKGLEQPFSIDGERNTTGNASMARMGRFVKPFALVRVKHSSNMNYSCGILSD